jgi:GTP-binding protein Era
MTKVDQSDLFYRKSKIRELLDSSELVFELGFLHDTRNDKQDVVLQKNINETKSREEFIEDLLRLVPESPQLLYPEDHFTTENTRDLVSEFVREKCLAHLHQEVPFQLAVQVHKFDESSHRLPHIDLVITVPKETHKRIVIGKAGEMIKRIGSESRAEIEELLGQKVFLNLNVAVKEDWDQNTQLMKEFKYVVPN